MDMFWTVVAAGLAGIGIGACLGYWHRALDERHEQQRILDNLETPYWDVEGNLITQKTEHARREGWVAANLISGRYFNGGK